PRSSAFWSLKPGHHCLHPLPLHGVALAPLRPGPPQGMLLGGGVGVGAYRLCNRPASLSRDIAKSGY
ncbi:MAG: hypothetical protein AAF587_44700, partial [Bacteroidota bacterium]